jgi:hypothetical protein
MTSKDHAIESNRLDQTVTAIIVHHPRRDSWPNTSVGWVMWERLAGALKAIYPPT